MGSKGSVAPPSMPQDSGADPQMMMQMMQMMQQGSAPQMPQAPQQMEAPEAETVEKIDWRDKMEELREKASADYNTSQRDKITRMSTLKTIDTDEDETPTESLLTE